MLFIERWCAASGDCRMQRRTMPQERYNAEWIVKKEVGLVLRSFDKVDAAVAGRRPCELVPLPTSAVSALIRHNSPGPVAMIFSLALYYLFR